MIYYWNKTNFEGLKDIGAHYSTKEGYKLYGEYCLLREKGIRKKALSKIEEFINYLGSQPVEFQREVAVEITELQSDKLFSVHQMMVKPLASYFEQIFESWARLEPQNPIPYRWLGFRTGNDEHYRKALELNSDDEFSALELIGSALRALNFQTHHMNESILLGDLAAARQEIKNAHLLITHVKHKDRKKKVEEDITYYKHLIDAWEAYQESGSKLSFPKWCESKPYRFGFGTSFYYDR